jgi:peptide-methionine (S)-S-oxide reductase
MNTETITLGGGCFWCLEAVFRRMRGILSVESGYMGGHIENPTYEQVCTGGTGHAEVVQLTFDTSVVSLEDILRVFFSIHDPTTRNRQGNDVGPQYRSAIFHRSEEQREAAQRILHETAPEWRDAIVTEVAPAQAFYKAEGYHQDYFERNRAQPYCAYVVAPKVDKFESKFQQLRRENLRL